MKAVEVLYGRTVLRNGIGNQTGARHNFQGISQGIKALFITVDRFRSVICICLTKEIGMTELVKILVFVCFLALSCVHGILGQDIPPDGQHQFDRVAKFNEVRNRSFDENLKAITTDDGGLSSLLIMGVLTNTLGWKDYFYPVFADPRMRRMHEQLAGMDKAARHAALSQIAGSIVQSLESMKSDDIAAGDFSLAHGSRCMLFVLCEYDDPRLEEVVDQWLEVREFIKAKYPRGLTVDENGNKVGLYTPVESIDEIYLYNVYFQKLVRLKGRQDAERQINEHARMADIYEPFWFIKELTWMNEGKDERVFAAVLGSGGAGRQLSLDTLPGSELLRMLREEVAKLGAD